MTSLLPPCISWYFFFILHTFKDEYIETLTRSSLITSLSQAFMLAAISEPMYLNFFPPICYYHDYSKQKNLIRLISKVVFFLFNSISPVLPHLSYILLSLIFHFLDVFWMIWFFLQVLAFSSSSGFYSKMLICIFLSYRMSVYMFLASGFIDRSLKKLLIIDGWNQLIFLISLAYIPLPPFDHCFTAAFLYLVIFTSLCHLFPL